MHGPNLCCCGQWNRPFAATLPGDKKKTPSEEQKTHWEIEYKPNYHFI